MLTSPLVRTRQTAEILAGALSPHPPVVNVDVLAAGRFSDGDRRGDRKARAVVLTSSSSVTRPGIGELAAWLIGSRNRLEFKKARHLPDRCRGEDAPRRGRPAVDADAEDPQGAQEIRRRPRLAKGWRSRLQCWRSQARSRLSNRRTDIPTRSRFRSAVTRPLSLLRRRPTWTSTERVSTDRS